MTIYKVVLAHLAADEMGKEKLPFALALALAKVKRSTEADTQFYMAKEQELIREYAELDENGNIHVLKNGRFILKDPSKADEYESKRKELAMTETEDPTPLKVTPPESCKAEWIDALSGFLDWGA